MSAVILAVIVVMWAVVLVPMWLRRHDQASESRSADKFSAAMRVLSRRQSSGSADRRYVMMPRRESAMAVHVSGASDRSVRSTAPAWLGPVRRRPAAPASSAAPASGSSRAGAAAAAPRGRTSLAVRRRRVFLVLLSVVTLTFLLAVGGVVGWVLQLVVDLLLVAFVVHLRTQAKRTAALRTRRAAPVAAASAGAAPAVPAAPAAPARPVAATPTAARYAAQKAAAAAAQVAPAPAEPMVEESVSVSAEATGTDDAAAWEPVPVPRPTYTMKPPAPPRRYPPVTADSDPVDAPVSAEDSIPASAYRDEADEDRLDEILTHRRAVND